MRVILYISVTFFLLSACTDFNMGNQGYSNLENLPESVSFNGDGDAVDLNEEGVEGDEVEIEVEAPNGTFSDITVTYSLGGDAIFGTDYTIEGATSDGGTLTIVSDLSDVNNFDKGTITIKLLTDLLNDEDEEAIILSLVSATRDGETVEVGRGGTEYGKTATVTILNTDVFLSFSSPSKISALESDETKKAFYIKLSAALSTDITYDITSASVSGLTFPADYTFEDSPTTPDVGIVMLAGTTIDTFYVTPVDDFEKSLSEQDSVEFYIVNAKNSSNVIVPIGSVDDNADTLQMKIIDDVKLYGLSLSSDFVIEEDTVILNSTKVYLFDVTLQNKNNELKHVVASSDISLNYSLSGTAVQGVDYSDLLGGTITLAKGETSANIPISVLQVQDPAEGVASPTLKLTLEATYATTDGEVDGVITDKSVLNIKIEK